jgi:hypothetical protein
MSDGEQTDPGAAPGQGDSAPPVDPVGGPGRRPMAGLKWVVVAAVASVVAVLVGVGIFVVSDDDDGDPSGGPEAQPDDGDLPSAGELREADVIVLVDRNAGDEDLAAIDAAAEDTPEIESFERVDEDEVPEVLGELLDDNEVLLERFEENTDLLPTAYLLVLSSADSETVDAVVESFTQLDGVIQAVPAPGT